MATIEQHRSAARTAGLARISSPSENRARARTAKERQAAALADLHREQERAIPDPEDDMSLRQQLMR